MAKSNYRVIFEDFTERHYIKKFRKAYKDKWPLTELAISDTCERIDNMLLCILYVNNTTRLVRVLLVYSKNEISEPNETQKWKSIIKNEYNDVAEIFKL